MANKMDKWILKLDWPIYPDGICKTHHHRSLLSHLELAVILDMVLPHVNMYTKTCHRWTLISNTIGWMRKRLNMWLSSSLRICPLFWTSATSNIRFKALSWEESSSYPRDRVKIIHLNFLQKKKEKYRL